MKLIRYILKGLGRILFAVPIYHISGMVKRDNSVWVVGGDSSQGGFMDNPKYFYIFYAAYLRERHGVRLIWISKKKKDGIYIKNLGVGECFYAYSLSGIITLLKARVYIYSHGIVSDLPFFISKNSMHVCLWHGIAMKIIGRLRENGKLQHALIKMLLRSGYPYALAKPEMVLSTSSFVADNFSKIFGVNVGQCFIGSYPRCEILNYNRHEILSFAKKFEPEITQKLILKMESCSSTLIYMPTWRDSDPDFLMNVGFDWIELNALLSTKNCLFILKAHPYSNLPDFRDLNNIVVLGCGFDIYPILPFTDRLITDYSSIYFDYLLLREKEIILFPFDYDDYVRNRGLALDYAEYMPGYRLRDFLDLLRLIENNFTLDRDYAEERERCRKIFWEWESGSEPFIEEIVKKSFSQKI